MIFPYHELEESYCKNGHPTKNIVQSQHNNNQNPVKFFLEVENIISFPQKHKEYRISINPVSINPDFKLYNAAIVKTAWYCHTNKQIDQISGLEFRTHTPTTNELLKQRLKYTHRRKTQHLQQLQTAAAAANQMLSSHPLKNHLQIDQELRHRTGIWQIKKGICLRS